MAKYLTLRICVDSGEASLTPTEKFKQEAPLWRLDILKDVIAHAEMLYEMAYEEWMDELTELQKQKLRGGS